MSMMMVSEGGGTRAETTLELLHTTRYHQSFYFTLEEEKAQRKNSFMPFSLLAVKNALKMLLLSM